MTESGNPINNISGRDREKRNEDLKRKGAQQCEIFSYATLSAATNKFDKNCKLGQGASGSVYKGTLKDGRVVAVKVLEETIRGTKEFENEVKLLSSLEHPNVVKLLGYCAPGKKKFPVYKYAVKLLGCYAPPGKKNLLVYEYASKNNLGELLSKKQLVWREKYAIIKGIARGLDHIDRHSKERIIHRDIKPANILIDGDLNPKIADFGLSRTLPPEKSHVSTSCRGTHGYIAPELHRGLRHVTMKSDVYSFGVVLLKIVSGKKFVDFETQDPSKNRFIRVHKLHKNDQSIEFMDSPVATPSETDQVKKCIKIGLLCTEVDPKLRPTMEEVISMFTQNLEEIKEPSGKPGPEKPGPDGDPSCSLQQPQFQPGRQLGDCVPCVSRFSAIVRSRARRAVSPAEQLPGRGIRRAKTTDCVFRKEI